MVSFIQNDESVLAFGTDIFHSYILLKKVFDAWKLYKLSLTDAKYQDAFCFNGLNSPEDKSDLSSDSSN